MKRRTHNLVWVVFFRKKVGLVPRFIGNFFLLYDAETSSSVVTSWEEIPNCLYVQVSSYTNTRLYCFITIVCFDSCLLVYSFDIILKRSVWIWVLMFVTDSFHNTSAAWIYGLSFFLSWKHFTQVYFTFIPKFSGILVQWVASINSWFFHKVPSVEFSSLCLIGKFLYFKIE